MFFSINAFFYSCEKLPWNLKKRPYKPSINVIKNYSDSIQLGATYLDSFNDLTDYGFCWSTYANPTISSLQIDDLNSSGNNSLGDLAWHIVDENSLFNFNYINGEFFVKAFAKNDAGITYSDELHVVHPLVSYGLPQVETNSHSLSNIHVFTAQVGGHIISTGGANILELGICYSESVDPTIDDYIQYIAPDEITAGNLNFSLIISDLSANTAYFYRAFVKTEAGLSYGLTRTFTTLANYEIGDNGPANGIIFYKDVDGLTNGIHYLECKWVTSNAPWSDLSSYFSCSATALGTGLSNTNTIVANSTTVNTAARTCYDLVYGGKNDWFLPSRDELEILYQNIQNPGINFFPSTSYFSSSEDVIYQQNAWTINFGDGTISSTSKLNAQGIIAVREF